MPENNLTFKTGGEAGPVFVRLSVSQSNYFTSHKQLKTDMQDIMYEFDDI